MVLPALIPLLSYALTAYGLADSGLIFVTGKDAIEHATGWSPYDALFRLIGLGGGDPAPVGEAVDAAAYDWTGMVLKAGLVALGAIVLWSMLRRTAAPKSKKGRR